MKTKLFKTKLNKQSEKLFICTNLLKATILLICFLTSSSLFAQNPCIAPPNQLIDPGFESHNVGIGWTDWYPSHGTPSPSVSYLGNYGVYMWSMRNNAGITGEGVFTCFDFDSTKCYNISFYAKVVDSTVNASFDLFATSILTPSPPPYNTPIPQVISDSIGSVQFSNIGTNWTYIEVNGYSPSNNYNQFWVYPYSLDLSTTAKIRIDEMYIIECDTCIYGCTDPLATNYNSYATCDDGSCVYPCILNITATDTCILDTITGITTGSISVSVSGGSGYYNYTWLSFTGNQTGPTRTGLSNGTYTVIVSDQINTNCVYASLSVTISCDTCIYGCTDPLAINYNSLATCDDGSCLYNICDPVPSALVDPGFENYTHPYFDDWYWSHGTPSATTASYAGNNSLYLWSGSSPSIGEGVFTCFDFDTTKCYDITFYAHVNDSSLNATFELAQSSSLTPNIGGSTVFPTVTSMPITSIPFSSMGSNWSQITIQGYQPSQNDDQFWIYPFYDINGLGAAKIWIDEIYITEVPCSNPCNLSLTATDTCLPSSCDSCYLTLELK
ncbi:MAG: hypothetical protein H8E84_02760, partial [Flavobacteriales bacterium]|nr:hypothetical protein [Flavobacteriales bacterium]